MKHRHFQLAVVAGVAALGGAACSTPEPALGGATATVTIDGRDTGGEHAVRCHQSSWTWYIETLEQKRGFAAVLQTDGEVWASSVEFRDFGGFTGSFWADHIGQARVTGRDGSYTIIGSAHGSFADDPGDAVSADFRIEADC